MGSIGGRERRLIECWKYSIMGRVKVNIDVIVGDGVVIVGMVMRDELVMF